VPNEQCGKNRHGGGWRNAVYASSPSVAAQERKQKAQKRSEVPHYIGCYKDNGARDLKHGPRKFGYTALSCHAACPHYKFFSLQAGSQCFCDNSLHKKSSTYARVPDRQCGKSHQGGSWRNAVYATPAAGKIPKTSIARKTSSRRRTPSRRRRWFRI